MTIDLEYLLNRNCNSANTSIMRTARPGWPNLGLSARMCPVFTHRR